MRDLDTLNKWYPNSKFYSNAERKEIQRLYTNQDFKDDSVREIFVVESDTSSVSSYLASLGSVSKYLDNDSTSDDRYRQGGGRYGPYGSFIVSFVLVFFRIVFNFLVRLCLL